MKIKFTGPEGQINYEIGRETGEGDVLEPGKSYEVSDKLAKSLAASSSAFSLPKKDEKVTTDA